MSLWGQFMKREDASSYIDKDADMPRVLRTKDFLALGVGTIVSTSIFTLPGVVAAKYAGPAVVLSFLAAAVVAGFVALSYAEMSATLPVAGSAYSWISVLFGEGFGWVAGWALLAEYFIAVAFVGSGLSANLRELLSQVGLNLPAALSGAVDTHTLFGWSPNLSGPKGGVIDIMAFIAIIVVAMLLSRGVQEASRVEVVLVVLKTAAVLLFIFVGITAIEPKNMYHSFPLITQVVPQWAVFKVFGLVYPVFSWHISDLIQLLQIQQRRLSHKKPCHEEFLDLWQLVSLCLQVSH